MSSACGRENPHAVKGLLRLAGCGKSPPAAFSHHSRLNVRHRVRFASSLAAALLDSLFAHPAWRFSIVSHLDIRDGYRGQNEFFRTLLEASGGTGGFCPGFSTRS